MVNMRAPSMVLLALVGMSCIRPSDEYEVRVHSAGIPLDDIQQAAEPMGGRIELARFRLHGSNLGHGVSGLFSDMPRADGTQFAIGAATFATPRAAEFDRNSAFVHPGPTVSAGEDGCSTRIGRIDSQSFSEYVDVGDRVEFQGADGAVFRLGRDPVYHPRPAGESWYVGYGGTLQPVIEGHADHPGNWRSGGAFQVAFPGTVLPSESTLGAVPYPLVGAPVDFPPAVSGLAIGGVEVRAPVHTLEADDDVRFPGPWAGPMEITWDVSDSKAPVTVTLRYLGVGVETNCSDPADCGAGFSCEIDTGGVGACVGDGGAGWNIQGEVTCTVADDGSFSFVSSRLAALNARVSGQHAVLLVSRISEARAEEVADVRTSHGKRMPFGPLRVRVSDSVVTRLSAPNPGGGP